MNFQRHCLIVLAFATMIAVGSSAAVCSNSNVTGVWGYFVGAAVGQFTADGLGNLAGSQTVSNNGVIVTQTYTGTYSVAKNCTGTITFNLTGGGAGHVSFVMDAGKKGAQVIDTDPGVAGGFALAQGTVTCGLTGTKQTFAANFIGKIPNTGPIAYVAQVVLNGSGKLSGVGTFDVAGTILQNATISGTYTENADCTGTAQMIVSGFGTENFNFVVVSAGKEILLLETDAGTVIGGSMQQ